MLLQTRLRLVGLLSVIGIVGAACAELPAITENQCGNRIVDTGEDCDTFASNGSSCRAAGSDGACHFDCSGTNVCPPTFSCGLVDKICRQATGTYDVANAQTIFAPTTSLSIVDYDGDGRADALTSGPNDVRIHYFDNRLSLSKTLLLPIQNPKFHVGPIGDDTVADLAILRTTGLVDVFRGQSDRTLAPVVYSSFPIPNTNVTGRAFLARNQISNTTGDPAQRPTGDDIFAFGSTDKGASAILDLAGRDASGTTAAVADEVIALPDSPVDKLAGSVAVGSYIEGSVCDQFAIGFVGDTKVDLYTPCRPSLTPKTYELNTVDARYVAPTRVELPAGATVGVSEQADASTGAPSAGAFSIDANGDGHDDLVIAGTALSATQIFIAYGIGDGTFSSSPTLSPVDNNAAALPGLTSLFANIVTTQLKSDLPLAIADLNHDKILDYVFPSLIYFSESPSLADGGPNGARYLEVATAPNGVTWTSAVVADVNRDGLPDIAATNPTGSIDFFLGTGGDAMSYLSYGLDGVPTNIVAGDFDGDLVNDLAFSVSGVAAQDAGASSNAIEVLFGQQQAFPAQPVSLGSSPSVVALVAAPLAPQYTGTAAPTDTTVSSMVALTVDAASNEYAAILQGNTDRIITSSFSLTPPTNPRGFVVRAQTGPMTTAKQNDVMFISRDTATAAGSTVGGVTTPPNYSFWYAPSMGEATLSSANLTEGPTLPSGIGWEQATLTGPSPEPNGIATTILVAPPPAGATGQPQLFVVDPKALTLGPAIPVPCNYANVTGAASIELRSSDFDGDGFHDLLVFCPDVSNVAVIVVYWGDGTSAYLASRMSKVPVPSDPLTSYASDREGAVTTRSVLMLTQLNLYSSTPGGSDGRTFGPPVKNLTLPGGNEINIGDIDGDGVLDLGIVDNTKTQVQFFRGIPVNDSASVP